MKNIKYKRVPKTSIDNYISGWEALNTGGLHGFSDWHTLNYWMITGEDNEIKLFDNKILNSDGIEYRFINYCDEKVFIASHPRALADLVYKSALNNENLDKYINISKDLLTEEERDKYWLLLSNLSKYYNEIDDFRKHEFPKRYYEEKYSGATRLSE